MNEPHHGSTGVETPSIEMAAGDDLPLVSLFEQQTAHDPELLAVEGGAGALSYAALDRKANQLAHLLQQRGVGADAPVAISLPRSLKMIVAVLGVLKAGGACVPVDPAYPLARRRYMVTDSGARWLLTANAAAADIEAAGLDVLDLERDRTVLEQAPTTRPVNPAGGENLAYIIYTSGSTGEPKGVMLPQVVLTHLVSWQLARPHFQIRARTLQFSSLSFDVSFQEMFTTWASGGTLVLVDDMVRRDPAGLLEHIVRNRIERIFLPFVALRGLAEAAVASGRCPPDLREVYTAGEQLQVDDTLRRFFASMPSCLLENQYGPTEAHVVTAHLLSGPSDQWPVLPPIGEPIANTTVLVLDSQRRPAPPGGEGEIHIGGVCLARGYAGNPGLTAERFIDVELPGAGPKRLYRTGDLGTELPDGSIQYHGRADQQVKYRGIRIEPGEIAAVLSSHPTVAQCVATVRHRGGTGQQLVAYVVPRRGSTFALEALLPFCRQQLPGHMVPSHFVVLDALPLTPSGKIDPKALPEPVFDRRALSSEFLAPRMAGELALVRIWSRVLGIEGIGVRDDYFDLGGDSILAVRLLRAVREELGVNLTLGDLAAAPTIEALATRFRPETGGPAGRWRSLVPIRPAGDRTPLFCVHGGHANVGSFPLLARQLPAGQPFYGLQWDGLTGDDGERTVEGMARKYLEEIRTVQARGPYVLAGQCIGGLVAWEMTRQLMQSGESVAHLFMFDSPNLKSPLFHRGRRRTGLEVLVRMKKDRRALAEVWLRRALGWPVRPEHRLVLAMRVMIRAAWAYQLPELPVPVPTLLIATGLADAGYLNLAGSWSDRAMGWTAVKREGFRIEHVEAEHNEAVYHPRSADLISRSLETVPRPVPVL